MGLYTISTKYTASAISDRNEIICSAKILHVQVKASGLKSQTDNIIECHG